MYSARKATARQAFSLQVRAAQQGTGSNMIPPYTSLVKYNNPVLISTNTSTNRDSKGGKKKIKGPAVERLTSQTEDILNSILPPREWTDDGQLWVQYVSSTPATRLDVTNLQDQLDQKLQQRQARETGICPVREELYSQCFDELIRQVTINCAERGLLLLRVRDEIHMTIAAYQTIYESSIAFGIRKTLVAEQRKAEMGAKIQLLQEEKAHLEQQVMELTAKCEQIKPREEERRLADETQHNAEVDQLKRTNDQLKTKLEQMLSAPKK